MNANTLKPADAVNSQYTIKPDLLRMRAVEIPGMTSVSFREVLPSIPPPIFPGKEGVEAVTRATREAISRVDLSKIQKGDSVNILASHHGFTLLGGALILVASVIVIVKGEN